MLRLHLFIRSAGNIEKRFGKHKMAMATTMAPAKDEVTVLEHATLKVSVINDKDKLLDLVPRLAEDHKGYTDSSEDILSYPI